MAQRKKPVTFRQRKRGVKPKDHDRLHKELLRLCLVDFLRLFTPAVLAYLDVASLEFLDQEVFGRYVKGRRRAVDIVVKARYQGQLVFFLIHVEAQAAAQNWSPARMFDYFAALTLKYKLPVYPIVLLSYPSPEKAASSQHVVEFPDRRVLEFNFTAIQLNRLNWRDYLQYNNPVAAALMTEMGVKAEEFVKVRAECIRTLARMQQQVSQEVSELIAEFWETYLPLDEKGETQLEQELADLPPEEGEKVMPFMNMWMRKGYTQGALEAKQADVLILLRAKFGRVSKPAKEQVLQLPFTQLETLFKAAVKFSSPSELSQWLHKHAPATIAQQEAN